MNDRKPPRGETAPHGDGKAKSPRLGREIQIRIGDKLRSMYDDIVDEGVPDRFASLLRQFDEPSSNNRE